MGACDKIRLLLDSKGLPYELKLHAEAINSVDSAKARGEDLSTGVKAMVLKSEKGFVMCALRADKKIDSKKLRSVLGIKDLRFATPEEVYALTGCLVGGVPPFGPLFGMDLLVDKSILSSDVVAFNAGERSKSIKMQTQEYLKALKSRVEEFSSS
jgi:Ala-tRNA(Pro) deacylase